MAGVEKSAPDGQRQSKAINSPRTVIATTTSSAVLASGNTSVPTEQRQSKAVSGGGGQAALQHVPAVLLAVILEIFRTLFTIRTGKQGLTRSSVFLIVFVIVHALGNSFVFAGKDAFNTYGAVLHSTPIIPAIEGYLALGFLLHGATAGYLTLTSKFKRKALTPGKTWNANVATMALSGSVLLGFLVWHVFEFRFGADYRTSQGQRDVFTLQVEVFSSAPKVAMYELAVGALGLHLWKGWSSAVRVLPGIESEHKGTALLLGQALTTLLCGVFAACPVFAHLQALN